MADPEMPCLVTSPFHIPTPSIYHPQSINPHPLRFSFAFISLSFSFLHVGYQLHRDFLLKPELLRAISDLGFEHPSEGECFFFLPFRFEAFQRGLALGDVGMSRADYNLFSVLPSFLPYLTLP